MTIDHIIALSHGGPHDPSNWQLAHWACNYAKGPIGRPAMPVGQANRIHVDVRMSPDLREQVRIAAERQGISLGAWLKAAALAQLARETVEEET